MKINAGLIQCKEVTNQTEHFLELFSRTLNFLRLKDVKTSLYIVVLIVRGCFTESTMSLAGFE